MNCKAAAVVQISVLLLFSNFGKDNQGALGQQNLSSTVKACKPRSSIYKLTNYTEKLYDDVYESYDVDIDVTLSDCSVCNIWLRLSYVAMLKPNTSYKLPFKGSGQNDILDFHKALRLHLQDRDDVPGWFAQSVLLNYFDRFFGPIYYCSGINETTGATLPGVHHFIDIRTLAEGPAESICYWSVDRVPYLIQFDFYNAFSGYPVPGLAVLQNQGLFPSKSLDQFQRATELLSTYFTPLTFCMLLFALGVIRRSLHITDSHVYYYHKALTITDMLMGFWILVKVMHLNGYMFAGVCLTQPTATPYNANRPVGATDPSALFGDFQILSLMVFSYTLQGTLAMDRFAALFFPIQYLRISNVQSVRRFILANVVVNVLVEIAELVTDIDFRGYFGSYQIGFFKLYGNPARSALIFIALCVQIVCAVAMFVKMFFRFLKPVHQNGVSLSKKLVPFYLLLGTCGLGLVSMIPEVIYAMWDINLALPAAQRLSIFGGATTISYYWALFRQRFRIIMISYCSSGGLVLHLLVSKDCRAAAKHILVDGREGFRKIGAKLRGVPSWLRKASVAPEAGLVSLG